MTRATTTILAITRERVVRADFGKGGEPKLLGKWIQDRLPGVEDLASVLEAALAMGPKKVGRNVYVLNADWWTQTLSLAGGSMRNVDEAQVQRALAFEAEPLSGMNAFDSVLGQRALPGPTNESNYWITEAARLDLESAEDVVRAAGSKLAGIAHPSGLPRSLAPDVGTKSWNRVELWPDAVVCLYGNGKRMGTDGDWQVLVINSDPNQGRWNGVVRDWQTRIGEPDIYEVMVTDPTVETADDGLTHWLNLGDDATLELWLAGWAAELTSVKSLAPMIRPPKRPLSAQQRKTIAGVIWLAAAIGCVAHYQWTSAKSDAAKSEKAAIDAKTNELATMKSQTKKQQEEFDKLKKETLLMAADVRHCEEAIAVRRRRIPALLEQLGRSLPENVMLLKIEGDGREQSIHGISLRPELAATLAVTLEDLADHSLWRVRPRKKQAQNLLENGGPWIFEVALEDVEPAHKLKSDGGGSSDAELAAQFGLKELPPDFDYEKFIPVQRAPQ